MMKRNTLKNLSVLILLFLLSMVFAACSSTEPPPPEPVEEQAAEPVEEVVEEAEAEPAETEVTEEVSASTEAEMAEADKATDDYGLVWYASAPHPYFEEVVKGVEAFEADFGISVEKQIGPDWEQASQNERVEALAAQGFKYFSVYPTDASGANGLYEELTANGVTVINFGASTLQPTTASFVVATDVKAAAMQATEALIESMGGEGKIINVLEVLEDSNTVLRKEGVEEVVAKYPDVEIIQEISGMTSVEEAVDKVGNVLSANINEVDGLIATGFTTSVGIAQVLGEYYDTGGDREIHAVGIDTDPTVMKAIEDGVMDGTIAQNPFGHGYLSLLALKLIAEGYQPVDGVYHIDSGTAFVTVDNIDSYADDIAAVTEQIKNDLTSKYLTTGDTAEAEAVAPEVNPENYSLVWYASAPHPYFEEVVKGVEAFEADFGIPVEKQIGPDWEQASQNERVEALAAQGFKYFSVYPTDASGANGLYEELTQNGVTVINFGASTLQPTTASFVVATDVKAAAMQATEALIESMGGQGKIINVLEVLEDSNTVLRKEGVEEVVAKYPDVEIIQEISGMTSVEEAVDKIGNVLSANINEVDGLIATGFTTSVGIAQVLGEYYDTGGDREIHAVGIDTDPTVMKAIEDGVMDGTIAQNPFGHGYLSLLALKLMVEGYQPVDGVYHIDSGTAFVTVDNLDSYADDIAAVTEQIKSDLTSKYLMQ